MSLTALYLASYCGFFEPDAWLVRQTQFNVQCG